jgi:hypothetical protein
MKQFFQGVVVLALLSLAGCRHVDNSEIVAKFQAAGGGIPDQATADQIGSWLSKHEGVRKELTPLCTGKSKSASADWANTDEGRVCAGLARANFLAPGKITSDHKAF